MLLIQGFLTKNICETTFSSIDSSNFLNTYYHHKITKKIKNGDGNSVYWCETSLAKNNVTNQIETRN